MKKSMFLILALLSALTFSVSGQNLTAKLSKDTLLLGNTVKLSFELSGANGEFQAPELSELNIVSGPNMSSSFQMINGNTSSKQTYTYLLKPDHDGAFQIAPAYVKTENNTIESQPLELLVLPNPGGVIDEDHGMSNDFFNLDPFNMESFDMDGLEFPDDHGEDSDIKPFDLDFPSFLFPKRPAKKDTTESKYKLRRI